MHSIIKFDSFSKTTLLAFAGTVFFFVAMNSANAFTLTKLNVENNGDFVVEPGKTEIFLNPGETVTRNISVTNRTNRPLEFNVGVEDFVGTDDAETTVMLLAPGTDTPYPLREYVSSELENFTLEFGEKMTFQVTISVPEDIEPGGHYGAIVISNRSPGQIDAAGNEVSSGTQLTSRIGSLILMRINGEVTESGYLESFNVSGPAKWLYQQMPTAFQVAFRNDGTVHLVPYGQIVINNMFGADVAQIPVDAYFALPDATRYQNINWPGKKFAFGYYTAEIELYKGFGDEFDRQKISFFVLPLIFVIPGLVFFLLLFAIIYFVSRRFEIKRK